MVHAALQGRANSADGRRLALWASIVVVVALATGLAQTETGHSILQKIGVYGPTANYTSLAFANPQSLPTHVSSASTRMRMSFDLANSSADPRSYSWSIIFEQAERDSRLATGEISVSAGNRVMVARTVKVSCVKGRVRMVVKIASPAESIDFWMTCSPRKGEKP
jgi:hypothetical protein